MSSDGCRGCVRRRSRAATILSSGDFGCEAEKLLTFFRAELRKHGAAVFDVSAIQPSGQPPATRGECDANDAAVVGDAATLDEPLTF